MRLMCIESEKPKNHLERESIGWAIFEGDALVASGYVCDGLKEYRLKGWGHRPVEEGHPEPTHNYMGEARGAFSAVFMHEATVWGSTILVRDLFRERALLDDCWHDDPRFIRAIKMAKFETLGQLYRLYVKSNPGDKIEPNSPHPMVRAREVGAHYIKVIRWMEDRIEKANLLVD
jgi:hypothetical protein